MNTIKFEHKGRSVEIFHTYASGMWFIRVDGALQHDADLAQRFAARRARYLIDNGDLIDCRGNTLNKI